MAAGLGFKTFTTGEVLTAADTNGYLMQGVLVFASAAARDAAITSPQEGQCCYLKDTDAVLTYSGAAWVGFDDSNAIQNSIVDAKGDLVAASGADTPARLAVGNNGETLVADSATATGLRYQGNYAAGKNVVINGDFNFWQRGTTSAAVASAVFLADRWKTILAGTSLNATYSQNTNVPSGGSIYSAKLQQLTNNATSVTEFGLHQIFEIGTVRNLAGKTVTASFWYRSNKTGSHYVRVYTVNATGGADVTTGFTVNAANTWEYKTINFSSYAAVTAFTGALTDNGGAVQIGLNLYPNSSMTVTTNDFFQVSQFQLEAGSVATAFQTATGTLQGELAACQRYYYKWSAASNGVAYITACFAYTGTLAFGVLNYPVTMRTTPTLTTTATATDYRNLIGATVYNSSSVPALDQANEYGAHIKFTNAGTMTGAGAGSLGANSTNAFLGFSAEL